MNLSIRQTVFALGAISLVLVIFLAGTGFWSSSALNGMLRDNGVISTALRNQLEADMMHDALRADVLAAILATEQDESAEREQILSELATHAGMFRDRIAANEMLTLPAPIREALAATAAPLAAYIAEAEAIAAAM